MNRDRITQLLALVVALLCLVGSSLLVPTINRQRRDLQGPDLKAHNQMPPKYAILAAALGSFRGLAVDVLWYRAEKLKQAGKLYEANTLAEWITTLQPRFPQVWSFHAWNMSYNISVMTHTPEERWNWVRKGIDLLRDEGIVYNPEAIRLYRELGWIFFHKVGQFTDDMHWYYKLQLAEQWQELMGVPTEGATSKEAAEAFKPIADAADRYFAFDLPSRETRQELTDLAEQHPEAAEQLNKLANTSLVRLIERLPVYQQQLRDDRQFRLAEQLDPIVTRAEARKARAATDPWVLLYEDAPAARPVVTAIRDAGFEIDERTLRMIGRLQMLSRYVMPEMLENESSGILNAEQRKLLALARDPQYREAWTSFVPFLRAKVLTERYHMDPQYMHQLMVQFGPLDWRHPASHAIYWSALGVQRAGEMLDATKYDILNTDRQVIQSLQNLMFYGRVSYDPFTRRIDLLPDPRFIPAYDLAMDEALTRAESTGWYGGGNRQHFQAGHENFLLKAIVYSYLYGDEQQAQVYYDKVRKLYGNEMHNLQTGRYRRPLADLVLAEMQEDAMTMNTARPFIEAMLERAFSQGLALGRLDVFSRFVELAQRVHTQYNEKRAYTTPNAPRERLVLPPFGTLLIETYANYMRSPGVDLLRRSRVYANTPIQISQRAYPKFLAAVTAQAQQMGLDPNLAFPPPPGLEEESQKLLEQTPDQSKGPGTVERQ